MGYFDNTPSIFTRKVEEMFKNFIIGGSIFLLTAIFVGSIAAQTVTVISKSKPWDDTVRVFVVWNGGTGNEEMPNPGIIKVGDIGKATKEFSGRSLYLLKQDNLKFITGADAGWAGISADGTLRKLKTTFGGKLPHVIVYINAGYEWDQEMSPKSHEPYSLLKTAADSGVGIVAIGDDAAYDGKQIFPLRGPGTTAQPVQYDGYYPGMAGAVPEGGTHNQLWIWLNHSADQMLPDGGLLEHIQSDSLWFMGFKVGGRGQSAADIWHMDTTNLDMYAFVGYQQSYCNELQNYTGSKTSHYVGATPLFPILTVKPSSYLQGYAFEYNTVAALQEKNHRIVMLGYQPQYLADVNKSSQLIYNAVYWVSKAHEMTKLPMPEAIPPGGAIAMNQQFELVVHGVNPALFTLHYTVDGSNPDSSVATLYKGKFLPPLNAPAFTVKAITYAKNKKYWCDSDMLVATYTVAQVKLSAVPVDGTHFTGTQTISINANPPDARVFYTLDGTAPDSTGSATILYSAPFTIRRSLTVKAIGCRQNYLPGKGTWSYIQDMLSFTVKADPLSGTHFGASLSIRLYTDPSVVEAKVYYAANGTNPVIGDNTQLYTRPFTIYGTQVTVKGGAVSEGYNPSYGTWIYYQDQLPKVKADPAGCTFLTSLRVRLYLDKPWDMERIYYTRDGSIPDESDSLYSDSKRIMIYDTDTLIAKAFCVHALPSDTTLGIYTRLTMVVTASYRDTNGDGRIDRAQLSFDKVPGSIPAKIVFINPFNATEQKVVQQRNIFAQGNNAAAIMSSFPYSQSTGFERDFFGLVQDKYFSDAGFRIDDSVAPVIDYAEYCPGAFIDLGSGKRAEDSLNVTFSEDIGYFDYVKPFKFTGNGKNYSMQLSKLATSSNRYCFRVDSVIGIDSPLDGDSIRINTDIDITDEHHNTQKVSNNRLVKLVVKPKPFEFYLQILQPYVTDVPGYIVTKMRDIFKDKTIVRGTLIVLDPMIDVIKDKGENITLSAYIYDALGNRIAEAGIGEKDNLHLQVGVARIKVKDKDRNKIVILWSRKNDNGRSVGSGLYLLKVFASMNGIKKVYSGYIGVQK